MKHNIRVHPPREAIEKAKGAILLHEDAIRHFIDNYINRTAEESVLSDNKKKGRDNI